MTREAIEGIKDHLLGKDVQSLQQAEKLLINMGFTFVGFHGCNLASAKSIVPFGFDPSKSGTGAGNERGSGLYVSHRRGLADDWADSSTQDGDPQPPKFETPYKSGDQGAQMVLRIYAENFRFMKNGVEYDWGVQNDASNISAGNASDLFVSADDTSIKMKSNIHDLEIVFRTTAYGKLAAIPSLGAVKDNQYLVKRAAVWGAHEAP